MQQAGSIWWQDDQKYQRVEGRRRMWTNIVPGSPAVGEHNNRSSSIGGGLQVQRADCGRRAGFLYCIQGPLIATFVSTIFLRGWDEESCLVYS